MISMAVIFHLGLVLEKSAHSESFNQLSLPRRKTTPFLLGEFSSGHSRGGAGPAAKLWWWWFVAHSAGVSRGDHPALSWGGGGKEGKKETQTKPLSVCSFDFAGKKKKANWREKSSKLPHSLHRMLE